ncbi:MAG: DUF2804 domain-containing protein [Treponema sp.]|jgi:hypothetical protein|nr:DUF2804 domain-containing protein [Treponema sp.]
MMPVEIEAPVSVLDASGRLIHGGWARAPYFQYNPGLIRASRRRVNESDRYIIFSTTHLVILEVLDSGYVGSSSISVISLKDKKRSTQMYHTPFPLGSFEMPESSETGSVRIKLKKMRIDFITMKEGFRIIKADIPTFGHHLRLRGEVVLSVPKGAESMVTLMPWRRDKNAFRYSRRSPWYIVEGVIQFGPSELIFTKGKAWGIFDWSRGVRPQEDVRYWAAACGLSDGRQVGFNVGYDSSDSRQGTENAFFLDGKLHKLDQVTFHISPVNWLEPWHFTSNDNRLEMFFTPHQEQEELNRMIFYSLKRRQVCGFFSGKVVLDDGPALEFQNITGFAEWRKTRF